MPSYVQEKPMNPVVHFEMPYQDAARVMKFYRTAFGWELPLLGDPAAIPGIGLYVSFVDTEGNRNSLLQPMGEGPDSLR